MKFSHHTTRRLSVALTMGGLAALGLLLYSPIFGQFSRDLITQPIDESKLVTVYRSTRFEATPLNDRGPVPDSFPLPHMLLQLKRSPTMEAELAQYIETLTDKKSPNFRKWISAQEIGEKYGPTQDDLATITTWLQSHGLTVNGIQPNRMVIDVSATAATLRSAFHTQVDFLNVNGVQHFANMTNPKFPAALLPVVVGLVQIHDFAPDMHKVPYSPNYYVSATLNPLVPADFETIYNINPLFRQGYHGEGQTITIVEDSDTYKTDVAVYRSTFLSKYTGTVTTTHPTGSNTCTDPGTNAADGEADLDGEVASAMAPNATIVIAACADTTTFGGLLALENLVNSVTPPSIVSMSYGVCEAANYLPSNIAFSSAFQTAAAAGSSIFVSTGDAGSSQCAGDFTNGTLYAYPGIGITGWGESIYNVSVGGTDYEDVYNANKPANGGLPTTTYFASTNTPTDGSAKSYVPEIPWNDSCAGYLIYNYEGYTASAGSGGFCNSTLAKTNNAFLSTGAAAGGPSACATGGTNTDQTSYLEVADSCTGYAKPSWQAGTFGNPADGVRDVPDVSMFASNGFWGHYAVVCFSDTTEGGTSCAGAPSTWSGFGGTSVATPLMASVQALVNQYQNLNRIGNPNPTYYAIAKAQYANTGTACYSVNLPGRRGLETSCAFQDITQGDNNVDCRANGTQVVNCYLPTTGTTVQGAISTQPLNQGTVTSGGTGYTSAPTCTLAAPSNLNQYISPQNTVIYAGGSQAACTATIATTASPATGSLTIAGTPSAAFAGVTVTVGATTYTFETTLTAPNQVLLYTSGSSTSTKKTDTAKNLEAVINNNSSQCTGGSGCIYTGQTANSAATATESSNVVSLTASTAGTAGNFALGSSNTADVTFSGGSNGQNPGYVNSITITNGGQGYAGGTACALTGGGGSGATCVAAATTTTAAPSYQPAWGATPGWDFATGLGSVNAYNLAINPAW